jgi:dTDP-4-dehydrorhamnose reductase
MLGRAVAHACEAAGHRVFALSRVDLDIRNADAVEKTIRSLYPDTVINCAAWTDVDAAESRESDAMQLNDECAALLAAVAANAGASIVFLSSDYVFDGARARPYVESDLPNPLSAYGRSKLGGETSVSVSNPRHFVVRTSWLFGPNGRNFVETMLHLADEQPEVLVVSDQRGCPTYTVHLAAALAELIESDRYGIHHIAGSGQCTWYEFASEIFDSAGLETAVLGATTEMLGGPAPRPAYSVLRSEREDAIRLPHWREGLAEYMADRSRPVERPARPRAFR